LAHVPQSDGFVNTTGGEGFSIRAKGYNIYIISVTREGSEGLGFSGLAHIPQTDFSLSTIIIAVFLSTATGGEGLSIRAEGYTSYTTAMTREGSKGLGIYWLAHIP
jgi:hypothetical protein